MAELGLDLGSQRAELSMIPHVYLMQVNNELLLAASRTLEAVQTISFTDSCCFLRAFQA
jgi:hypothetical protein